MNLPRQLLATFCLLLTVAGAAGAAEAVRFSFAITQRDTTSQKDVLLYVDTADVVKGIPATGFMAVMSVEMRVNALDSNSVSYSVQVSTANQPAATGSRDVRSEYGLPSKLSDLHGKNGSSYNIVVRPLKKVRIGDDNCSISQAVLSEYNIDPTAHTDMYYKKNTLGDFYWNLAKNLFEAEYDQFNAMNRFSVPGKSSIYLCPCAISSVIWDERFGQVVDPTRATAYVLYTTANNSADPFVLMLLSTYREYGYAPAFLADGLANFGALAVDEMKALVRDKKNKPLGSLLESYTYFTSDARVSDLTSATFVKYLIASYSLDRFLKVYRAADDLNLAQSIEKVYGKPIADLEKEWLRWIDGITLRANQFEYYAERSEAMFDYQQMLSYAKRMKATAITRTDSISMLPLMTRASFNSGDYYGATAAQWALLSYDTNVVAIVPLAGYQMMNGLYDSAMYDLLKAQSRDSSNQLVRLNIGLNKLFTGDTAGAKEALTPVASSSGAGSSEAQVILGHLLLTSREKAERARSVPLFQSAVAAFQSRVNNHDVLPSEQMWLGMAFLGLDDQSSALNALQLADYLESRPFYRGIIRLWLGKAADLRGERDVAVNYYNSVLSNASAHYTQQEARRYLKTPYTQ